MMEPFDVFDAGRMAVFADPSGAVIMAWQPKEMIGAYLVNEPGTLSWNELQTRDPAGAKEFYGRCSAGRAATWTSAAAPTRSGTRPGWRPSQGNGVGGMIEMTGEQCPHDVPPNWLVYFAVDDTDATVAKAKELGGAQVAEPFDIEGVGRIAVLSDPNGAAFAVITDGDARGRLIAGLNARGAAPGAAPL